MEFLLFFGAVVLVVLLPLLLTVALLAASFSALRDRREAWRAALVVVAARHGLHLATPTATAASGVLDGFEVTVDLYEASTGKAVVVYSRIRVTGGQPPELSFSGVGLAATIEALLHGVDIEVGDPAFDAAVVVRGPPAEVSSFAGPAARAAVGDAVAVGAVLRDGVWCLQVPRLVTDPDELDRLVAVVVRAAGACRDRPRPREGLKARVDHDPEPNVRRTALERGLAVWTPAELLGWAEDVDPGVAMRAARASGARGHHRLVALLDTPEVGREAAVALSRGPAGPERARLVAWLVGALDAGWPEGLEALGRVGTAAEVPALQAVADDGGATRDARRRAREAIVAIQSRIDADPGALSLAPDTRGGLSEAEPPPRRPTGRPIERA